MRDFNIFFCVSLLKQQQAGFLISPVKGRQGARTVRVAARGILETQPRRRGLVQGLGEMLCHVCQMPGDI